MKTFEENLNAWLEGGLQGKELEEFEASLPEISAAELEAQPEAPQLAALLKEHVGAVPLANADFFNHQLQTQIESDLRAAAPSAHFAEPRQGWWSIGRLALTGALSLAAFALVTFFVMREDDKSAGQSAYLTQIINARITDPDASPDATITMFEATEGERATVLWVDGLQSLPSEYATK